MTTAKLAEIAYEVYRSEGIGFETNDRLDEIISRELRDAGIEIDEDAEDSYAETEYARPAVRHAMQEWADELGREAGNEA